jgi:GNAT superfamily N-acetyltransferase
MIVRIAQLGDAAAVIDLYRGYDRTPDREMSAHEIASHFAEINRSGFVAVAVIDGVIVGSYSMYFCANLARAGRPFAVVENVIVGSSIRRRGIGRALMAHAQQSAREKDCYKVMLATGANRPENIKFYEACGFVGNKVGFQVRYGV